SIARLRVGGHLRGGRGLVKAVLRDGERIAGASTRYFFPDGLRSASSSALSSRARSLTGESSLDEGSDFCPPESCFARSSSASSRCLDTASAVAALEASWAAAPGFGAVSISIGTGSTIVLFRSDDTSTSVW